MSHDPMDKIPSHNRVSIRAVLVKEGDDPSAALAQAGFSEVVAIPVVLGEEVALTGGFLGNGATPNLTAVLETEQANDFDTSSSIKPTPARPRPDEKRPPRPVTTTLPAAFGLQPLAPVRKKAG